MKAKIVFLVVLLGGIASADINYFVPYTQATEKEVTSFVTVGKDEKEIGGKFGSPNLTDTGKDGLEVWQYLVNPHTARVTHSNYYGFEVFFKKKKVTYLGIIHAEN